MSKTRISIAYGILNVKKEKTLFAKDLTSDKRISIMEEAYDIKSIAQISDECDETKERMLGLMKKL